MQRLAIVTGASGGIGREIARGLLGEGYHVILAVRDQARGERAIADLGGGEIMPLDVADLDSVRAFAKAFLGRSARLELLVNNAGIHTAEARRSPQGFEITMATNHLGHFLLTDLLLDALKAGKPSRIVNVASEAHRGARSVSLDPSPGLSAYAQSKLANIMFTLALARRIEESGVSTFAVHPGSVRTRWARGKESGIFRFGAALAAPFLLSPAQGARTPLHAALSRELDGKNGLYLVRRRIATPNAAARDVAAQERLWRESEKAVGR